MILLQKEKRLYMFNLFPKKKKKDYDEFVANKKSYHNPLLFGYKLLINPFFLGQLINHISFFFSG